MATLSFPDIKKAGSDRVQIILDKVFKQGGKKNIFETQRGDFYASGILIDGNDYPGNASAKDKKTYAREIKTKITKASTVKALGGDFDLIGKIKNSGSKIYLPITKVIKTEEFGGGTGSGGGAKDTEVTESLQCYYTSVLYNGLPADWKILSQGIDKKILAKSATYCDANVPLAKCLTLVKKKESLISWVDKDPNVFVKTANAIKSSTAGGKFRGKVYFHRDSKFMKAIYERRKRCMEHDKKEAKKPGGKMIAPGSFSNDKWNPGDIWMSKLSKSASDPFPDNEWEGELKQDTCDWTALRNVVYHVADIGQTLGVSLKKVTGAAASVTEFNLPTRQQNIDVKYLGFTFGQTGDFFSSADIYLYFSGTGGQQAIQWRAFDSTKSWQGEIKGAAAAGGKIGGGGTNYYVEKYFDKSIGGSKKGKGWSEKRSPDWNDAFKLYTIYNSKQLETKLKSGNKPPPTIKNQTEFNAQAKAYINVKNKPSEAAFKFGKYMGLLLIDAILDGSAGTNPPNKKDKISGNSWALDTFRYAQSNIDISSFYIKVS